MQEITDVAGTAPAELPVATLEPRPWPRARDGAVVASFTVTLFLSSGLLFLVEPMFAKMVLPVLGSSPAVWNTSILFFQAALLVGYAYAHVSTRLLGARKQAALHAVVLLLPLLVLPIGIREGWIPPAAQNPVLWLLALLTVSVGLPFFIVSATAPLLQRWFAGTGHRSAGDPYFLYRASNLGSAVALVAYPVLVEPSLRLAEQAWVWSVGYGVLVLLTLASAILLWRSPREPAPAVRFTDGSASLGVARRLRWVGLAFVPSSLMLGVTSYMTTDIAPIPLLWVIPLALYLLSFVLVFSPRHDSRRGAFARVLPFAVVLVLVVNAPNMAVEPLWLPIAINLLAFFVAAMVCHGEVARDRPSPHHLTEFYLWVAIGGVLGGVFNALVAPAVFNSFVEYPLAIVLACLCRPLLRSAARRPGRYRPLPDLVPVLALGAAALVAGLALTAAGMEPGRPLSLLALGVPLVASLAFAKRATRFGLAVGAVLLASSFALSRGDDILFADRTFYGIHVVQSAEGFHLLTNGTTLHGAQSVDPLHRLDPLTYYSRSGPIGQLFDALEGSPRTDRVGIVGLGAGSLACYGRPGNRWTFYEIDPLVERIARDPRLFTYLSDCPGTFDVVLGDGLLSLARDQQARYGVIVLDAFNSDSIPTHLVTREALRLYLERLEPHGVLAFHISNRYLDLHPVLGNLAADAGLVALAEDDLDLTPAEARAGKTSSMWVIMARAPTDLAGLDTDTRWYRLGEDPSLPVWTDDFTNVFSVLRWR